VGALICFTFISIAAADPPTPPPPPISVQIHNKDSVNIMGESILPPPPPRGPVWRSPF